MGSRQGLIPFAASAVPLEFSHQGRIFDSLGVPLDGACVLDFGIYDVPAGGTAVWTETVNATCDDGYFSVDLGEVDALDPAAFDGSSMYLGLGPPLRVPGLRGPPRRPARARRSPRQQAAGAEPRPEP